MTRSWNLVPWLHLVEQEIETWQLTFQDRISSGWSLIKLPGPHTCALSSFASTQMWTSNSLQFLSLRSALTDHHSRPPPRHSYADQTQTNTMLLPSPPLAPTLPPLEKKLLNLSTDHVHGWIRNPRWHFNDETTTTITVLQPDLKGNQENTVRLCREFKSSSPSSSELASCCSWLTGEGERAKATPLRRNVWRVGGDLEFFMCWCNDEIVS